MVTASTVPALLCHHPYETPLSVYLRAIGESQDTSDPVSAAAGHDAELMIPARVHRLRPDLRLRKMNSFFRHPRLSLGGTPDFEDSFAGIWQAKCVARSVFKRDWEGEPPLWVLIQHQCEYLLTGRASGGIVCLVRDGIFTTRLHEIEPHEGTMRAIERVVAEMTERVANREPPPPDFARDANIIESLNKTVKEGKTVDLRTDNHLPELTDRYLEIGEAIAKLQMEQKAIRAEILTKMGDAAKGEMKDYTIWAAEVGASEGTKITEAMVGQVVGERKGYKRLNIVRNQ